MAVHCKPPLTRNSTLVTPTLSEALADIVTVLLRETVLPFSGFVIETVGCTISLGGVGVGEGTGVGVEVGVGVGVGVGILVETVKFIAGVEMVLPTKSYALAVA